MLHGLNKLMRTSMYCLLPRSYVRYLGIFKAGLLTCVVLMVLFFIVIILFAQISNANQWIDEPYLFLLCLK